MKRTLIAVLAVLLLASLMGCRQRQAGLTEYHEALSLIDQGDTPAALTLLEKAGHRATTDSANASGLHFMMADLYHRSGIRDSATLYYRKVLAHGSLYARRGAHRQLADYALDMGNTEAANAHMHRYGVLSDSILGENDAEALRRMTALYDYSLRERENVRLEKLGHVRLCHRSGAHPHFLHLLLQKKT